MNIATQFAATEAASDGILGTLGIDWTALALQGVAFFILLFLLAKFVYPIFMKTVDERQAKIEEGANAAKAAEEKAAAAEEEVARLLQKARQEASAIVATAKNEATTALEAAEQKAKDRADKIVENAHEQITKDVQAAKEALHNETIDLVARATETVIGKSVDASVDNKVVETAIKEAKA